MLDEFKLMWMFYAFDNLNLITLIKRNCIKDFKISTLRNMFLKLVKPHVEDGTVIWNPSGSHIGHATSVKIVQVDLFSIFF